MKVGQRHFVLSDDGHDLFFKHPRTNVHVESRPPSPRTIRKEGDFAHAAWMRHFVDGTICTQSQRDARGRVVLLVDDALRVMRYDNPLRDPVLLTRRDGALSLRDGFHRIHEAMARGYAGRVHCVVLDMDDEDDEED